MILFNDIGNSEGKVSFGKGGEKRVQFAHAKFKVSIRHSWIGIKLTAIQIKFKKKGRAGDMNLRVKHMNNI